MRAVAYIRVSSDEQVQGTSLDSQEKACIEFASKQGLKIESNEVFREEGVSAKIIDRPKLAEMLEYCSKNRGDIQYCIVWKVDRLARKSEYHHVIKAHLAKYGVKLASVTEPIGDDPMGNLMETVLSGFAQFDNDIRTLRTTAGMKARTEQGGWPHQPPYGYRKKRLPSGVSTLTPDKVEAKLVQLLFAKFESGNYTIKRIADFAYSIGIRDKKGGKRGWESIKWLLINPLYAGFVSSKLIEGKRIKGLHEPLISERTYFRVQAIINGDIKKYSKHAELEWPLRGGFLKHTCGKAVTGSAPTGRNGPSPRYSCMGSCKAQKGSHVSKRREVVHDDFLSLIGRVRLDKPTQKLFKEIVLRTWNNEYKDAIEHNSRLNEQIEACTQKKSRIIDMYINGKLSDDEKTLKIADVDKELALLNVRYLEADNYVSNKEEVIDGALMFMTSPGLFWNLGDIEVKKRVQDAIFPEGLEYDFDKGFGTVKLAESYQLITKIADNNADNQSLAPSS